MDSVTVQAPRPPLRERLRLKANALTALVALTLTTVYSGAFWQRLLSAGLPEGIGGPLLLLAAWGVLFGSTAVLLSLPSWRRVQQPVLATLVMLSALAAYFMDNYGLVIDRHALQSMLETDLREGSEWLSGRMAAYAFALGLVPALAVLWIRVDYRPWRREVLHRLGFIVLMTGVVAVAIAPFTREFASLARNHAELRDLATPINLVNAVRGHVKHGGIRPAREVAPLGADARVTQATHDSKPLLLVLVVGESARASSFSLAGYSRDTNPELRRFDLVFFPNVSSCGTNTATSLPCMFSALGHADYDEEAAAASENLLDVLAHAGFAVEWEDNNTGSKGLAARQKEERMSSALGGAACDADGCLDQSLADHLRQELGSDTGNRVLVLHQIGSHGPAYSHRYPPEFALFQPSCDSVSLQECSREQIVNSYDNTIRYTDHQLASLISILREQETSRTSALLYVSDHGESTGEHGLFLHGAPYIMAPEEQTRVPMLLWSSPGFTHWRGLDMSCLHAESSQAISHDNLFHSVLGLLDIHTSVYRRDLDVIGRCARS